MKTAEQLVGNRSWRLRNSLYLLSGFVGFGWAGLLYTGLGARRKSWVIWAVLYALGFWGGFLGTGALEAHPTLSSVPILAFLSSWLSSAVHLARLRPQWLWAKAHRSLKERPWYETPIDAQDSRDKVNSINELGLSGLSGDYFAAPGAQLAAESDVTNDVTQPKSTKTPPEIHLVDWNSASAQEMASLGEIGLDVATRIVEERRLRGKYKSLSDLTNRLGFPPHIMARIQRASLGFTDPSSPPPSGLGRLID